MCRDIFEVLIIENVHALLACYDIIATFSKFFEFMLQSNLIAEHYMVIGQLVIAFA
jgi:hypothetical protein